VNLQIEALGPGLSFLQGGRKKKTPLRDSCTQSC